MKALDKRIFRNLKSNLGQYLAIFVLLAATIGFGSSFLAVADSVEENLSRNREECRVEDGNFTLNEKVDFSNSDYEIAENFYVNLEKEYTLRVYKNRENINKISIFEGYIPTSKDEIALDRTFAESNEIKINDYIEIDNLKLKVVGKIAVPDYTSLFKNNSDLMFNTKDFGIGFVNEETFREIEENYSLIYNYSYIGDTDSIKEYLQKDSGIILKDFLPQNLNQAITFLDADMGTDVPSMRVLIYIVVAIIAFVFVILAINNIEADAKSIGTLKALGCRNSEIIFHYMKVPLIITIIAAIIGNILGYTVLIEPFANIYFTTFSIPPLELNLNMEAFLLTTLIPIAIMIVINFFMLKKKLELKTIKFLRNDIRKNKNKQVKLSKKLSFKSRYRIRIILDNIGNFITLFIGIYLSSLILIFSLGLGPVIDNYKDTIVETTPAEYQYIVKAPIPTDEYKLTQYTMKTYSDLSKKDISITMMGIDTTDKYFKDLNLKDMDDGVIISDSYALKEGIKVGDIITLTDENNHKDYEFKVLDIYGYRSTLSVFVKQSELNEMLDYPEGYYNTIFADGKIDIDSRYVLKEIYREDIGDIAGQMMTSFEGIFTACIIFSVIIYLVLMYVLIKVIIEKNALNISLMKVLGYDTKEVNSLFLTGTAIFVIVMLIVVNPLEVLTLNAIVPIAMSMLEGYFEVIIPASVYVKVVLVGVITYFVINTLLVKKINKIPMEDALKDRE